MGILITAIEDLNPTVHVAVFDLISLFTHHLAENRAACSPKISCDNSVIECFIHIQILKIL